MAKCWTIINRSPGDPGRCSRQSWRRRTGLCGAAIGPPDGTTTANVPSAGVHGFPDEVDGFDAASPSSILDSRHTRLSRGSFVHIPIWGG